MPSVSRLQLRCLLARCAFAPVQLRWPPRSRVLPSQGLSRHSVLRRIGPPSVASQRHVLSVAVSTYVCECACASFYVCTNIPAHSISLSLSLSLFSFMLCRRAAVLAAEDVGASGRRQLCSAFGGCECLDCAVPTSAPALAPPPPPVPTQERRPRHAQGGSCLQDECVI
jgi:hypothetical protein